MTGISSKFGPLRGEYLFSMTSFLLSSIILFPLRYLPYVQGNELGAVLLSEFISLGISYYVYKSVKYSEEVSSLEVFFINLILKKIYIRKVSLEEEYKCSKCGKNHNFHNDFNIQDGVYVFLNMDTIYEFHHIYCNNCRELSEQKIFK